MKCRCCSNEVEANFVDLGSMPPSNAYLHSAEDISQEQSFPLRVNVCHNCWLVQTEDFNLPDELFTADYAYFSSASTTWLDHAKQFAEQVIPQLKLNSNSFVVELACNDGYLLNHFVNHHIPCLGIEPTMATAAVARSLDISVMTEFFGQSLAHKIVADKGFADLIIANNVLAHVPDINDFVAGINILLAQQGKVSIEFPHLLNLIQLNQFDTIYHEHYSYLSLHAVDFLVKQHDLRIFDVQQLPTHGGSLRVWLCHQQSVMPTQSRVNEVLVEEVNAGLTALSAYNDFQQRIERIVHELMDYLLEQKQQGRKVVAYGAAAKGNTLMNYAHINSDLIEKVYDVAPSKQGKWMPGSHIPIVSPENIQDDKPDVVVILPWNIETEIKQKIHSLYQQPVTFVKAIPTLKIETC